MKNGKLFKKIDLFYKKANMSTNEALNILDLKSNFTEQELKTAYRKAILRNHPDLNQNENSHETASKINMARDFLTELLETKSNVLPSQEEVEKSFTQSYSDRTEPFDQLVKEFIFGNGMNIGDLQVKKKSFNRDHEDLPHVAVEINSTKRMLQKQKYEAYDFASENNVPSYIGNYFIPGNNSTRDLIFSELKQLLNYLFEITGENWQDYLDS